MQRPFCIITTTAIKKETTEVRTLRVLCALISLVLFVVKIYSVLNELAMVHHTHPNPPFEKGGRTRRELFSHLSAFSWLILTFDVPVGNILLLSV